VFPTKTAKFLFWLGVVIMVVGVLGHIYSLIPVVREGTVGYNAGAFAFSIVSPLWEGGLLIGVAKILEKLHSKTN
jgi:hypothetical protein